MTDEFRCPKCQQAGGDGWEQCQGRCPLSCSPHFDEETGDKFFQSSMKAFYKMLIRAASVLLTIGGISVAVTTLVHMYGPLGTVDFVVSASIFTYAVVDWIAGSAVGFLGAIVAWEEYKVARAREQAILQKQRGA